MNYLGIDYGLSNIGLAISSGVLAEPLMQLKRISDNEVIFAVLKICEDHDIDKIIVGVSEGIMGEKTQQFARNLEQHTSLPVILFDETLSSFSAKKYLFESGAKQKKRQTKQHQTAAAVILQSYLDEM